MTNLLASWRVFDFMITFWHHDISFTSWRTLWSNDEPIVIMTNFVTFSWWACYVMTCFWRHNEFSDVMTCFDFMTNFLISWPIFEFMTNFWHIFDVMTYILTPRSVFDVMTKLFDPFWSNDELFEVITNLLSSWRVFDIWTSFLTSWRAYDIMTNFWFDKHLDVKTYVALIDAMELFDDMRHFLTSWCSVRRQTKFLRYGVFSWRTLCCHDVFLTKWPAFCHLDRIFGFNYFMNKLHV